MTDVTEQLLINLCDNHYACTRRVVTSIALPPGSIDVLKAEIADRIEFPHLSMLTSVGADWCLSLRSNEARGSLRPRMETAK